MLVSIIAALDRCGLIGDAAGLPWHLPADLRRFRACTWGKPLIVGRRTFELIGKPLPGRTNIVLTHDPGYGPEGCRVARTFQEALASAGEQLARSGGEEVMVIGGARVYAEALPWTDRLYLTLVEGEFTGSVYFPTRELLRLPWRPARAAEVHPADDRNNYPHSFHVLERVGQRTGFTAPGEPNSPLEGVDLAALLARGTVGPGGP